MIITPLTLLLIVLAICFTVLDSLVGVAVVGGLAVAYEVFRAYVEAQVPDEPGPAERVEDEFES